MPAIMRLPNNETTMNVETYRDAWERLARPIEEFTGHRVLSFDPGLLFQRPNKSTYEVPTDVAMMYYELLTGEAYK